METEAYYFFKRPESITNAEDDYHGDNKSRCSANEMSLRFWCSPEIRDTPRQLLKERTSLRMTWFDSDGWLRSDTYKLRGRRSRRTTEDLVRSHFLLDSVVSIFILIPPFAKMIMINSNSLDSCNIQCSGRFTHFLLRELHDSVYFTIVSIL